MNSLKQRMSQKSVSDFETSFFLETLNGNQAGRFEIPAIEVLLIQSTDCLVI